MVGRVLLRGGVCIEEDILSIDYRYVKRGNVDFCGYREKGSR